jgi:nitrite reductase/ring-hydroxylating ferredoxin subunit/uncharacterized membrane protein
VAIPILRELVDDIAQSEALDGLSDVVAPLAERLTASDGAKNALSGVWLGHRLHPLLTMLPIGTWVSATLLDLLGGKRSRPAADRLVGLGIVSSAPAVVAGLNDWQDGSPRIRRIGLVHAVANAVGLTLQLGSWVARRRGHRLRGRALSLGALGAVGLGGYLGGHLAYVEGAGVSHDPEAPDVPAWRTVAAAEDLVPGRLLPVGVDGRRVVLVDDPDAGPCALAATCNHAGAPLDEGSFEDGCVVCPWHGSRFRVADGSVVRGPATDPQPVYDVRRDGDKIQIRNRP